jgi:hypothetical protein
MISSHRGRVQHHDPVMPWLWRVVCGVYKPIESGIQKNCTFSHHSTSNIQKMPACKQRTRSHCVHSVSREFVVYSVIASVETSSFVVIA